MKRPHGRRRQRQREHARPLARQVVGDLGGQLAPQDGVLLECALGCPVGALVRADSEAGDAVAGLEQLLRFPARSDVNNNAGHVATLDTGILEPRKHGTAGQLDGAVHRVDRHGLIPDHKFLWARGRVRGGPDFEGLAMLVNQVSCSVFGRHGRDADLGRDVERSS